VCFNGCVAYFKSLWVFLVVVPFTKHIYNGEFKRAFLSFCDQHPIDGSIAFSATYFGVVVPFRHKMYALCIAVTWKLKVFIDFFQNSKEMHNIEVFIAFFLNTQISVFGRSIILAQKFCSMDEGCTPRKHSCVGHRVCCRFCC
jgi:hypothetical protein